MRQRSNVITLDIKEIIRLYCEEMKSISFIANLMKVNHGTIKLRLSKAQIKLRKHSENQKIVMNNEMTKQLISKKTKESQPDRKATNLKKYGCEVPSNGKIVREKWKKEHLEKHGVIWPNQREDVRCKFKETCIRKYGVDNISKVVEYKDKATKKRHHDKTEDEKSEIWSKTVNTWKKNFNTDNPLKNSSIKEKIKQTCLDRYGVDNPFKIKEVKEKINFARIENRSPIVLNRLNYLNIQLLEEFKNITSKVKVKCLKCNNQFKTVIDYIFNGYGLCPNCFPPNTSIFFEKEISKFIRTLSNERIESNDRSFLGNKKEIDIIIPSKNIAIECDGLFYHSDKMLVDKYYHVNKTKICESKNFKLIHIFEDEWYFKKEIVKSRLSNLLGFFTKRIHARKCIIKEIEPKTKNQFLEENHIQGKDNSVIKLGAFYENELVSTMTFSKGNISKGSKAIEGVWELNRFCSKLNHHIPGIASKLLSHFKRNCEWKEIFSYADRRWSTGNVYEKLGFELSHITEPNYWYVKGMKRIHRFNLRKRPDEPKDITEWYLREQEGFLRIWDCGNLKFVMRNTNG